MEPGHHIPGSRGGHGMTQLITPTDAKLSRTMLGCGGRPTFPTPPPFRCDPVQSQDPTRLRGQ